MFYAALYMSALVTIMSWHWIGCKTWIVQQWCTMWSSLSCHTLMNTVDKAVSSYLISYLLSQRWLVTGPRRVNLLAPGRCGNNFTSVIFMLQVGFLNNSCEIALGCISQNPFNDKSTLFHVMAWYHQATSHYMKQCRPWSILPYGVIRPGRVKIFRLEQNTWLIYRHLTCFF